MLTVRLVNDGTGDVYVGNYRYEVLINDRVIEKGQIFNHLRESGWTGLLRQLLSGADTDTEYVEQRGSDAG